MPVLAAHCCTAARCGPHMPDRRKDSIPSTWKASAVSLAYPGKTECPTPRSCPELTFRACSPCSDSAGCIGGGMSTAWRMAASQKAFSMESWHLEGDPKAAHNCAIRMSARETGKHLTLTPIPGRTLQPTARCGEALWTNTSRQRKRSWWMQKQEEGPAERSATTLNRPETTHKCDFCGRDCFSHIGLYSHKRCCNNWTDMTTRCTPMIKLDQRRPYMNTYTEPTY